MTSAIGFRAYVLTVHPKGNRTAIPFDDNGLKMTPNAFVTKFVTSHATAVQNDERERSWYFEQKDSAGSGNSTGYVHYGTFGFESNLVNSKTKTSNYRRQVDDVEEIPLFYEFWWPKDSNHILAMFQSFAGRSCIQLVLGQIQEDFVKQNPGYALLTKKLLPNDGSGGLYSTAPVKRLRLIRRNLAADAAERYLGPAAPDRLDFEVILSAKRKGTLGLFGSVVNSLGKNAAGVVVHDGIAFHEAVADIKIGGKIRPVGVFGSDTDAGVIDITEDVTRGKDGHPTLKSLQEQSDKILQDFHSVLTNGKP